MRESHAKLALLISLLVLLVYSNILLAGFIWDDYALVKDNYLISQPFKYFKEILTQNLYAAGSHKDTFYRPLETLSFALDYSIWKQNPLGYHLGNVLMHLINSLLLYFLIFLLSKNKFLSFATAIFYAVHPVHTEAVAYVSGRADPLVGIFIMSTLILFFKSFDRPYKLNNFYFFASVATFILSILSKEIAIFLPLVLLVYTFFKKKTWKAVPFFLVLGFYFWLRLKVVDAKIFDFNTFWAGLGLRSLTFVSYIPAYLRILLAPFNLHISYSTVAFKTIFTPQIFYPLLVLLAICLWLAFSFKRNKALFFASLWFIYWLLPQSNIFPINAYFAEHFLYIPSMGYFFAIAFMVDKIQAAETKKIMTGIFIAAIIFYSAVTVRQNFYWSRPFEFFKKITQLSPRSFAAFNILGLLYEEKGLYPSAEENYRESIELNPGYYEANVNLGRLYSKSGRGFEAERLFNKAIIIDKNRPESFSLLGYLYLDRGQPDKASGYFNKSVGLRSRGSFLYHVESGIIKRLRREYNQAIKEFEMAILINPENSLVFNNLGTVYKLQGNFDAAIACYQQALKFDRWFSAAYGNLAVVYAILNDNRAEYYFNKALEISPNDVSMIFNLGLYYFENGRKDLAYKYFLKVLKLEPTHKLAKEYLEKSGK